MAALVSALAATGAALAGVPLTDAATPRSKPGGGTGTPLTPADGDIKES